MLSRVADAVYWMNRYVERAENVARFVEVNLHLALDLPEGVQERWEPVIATTGDDKLFMEKYGAATRANAMRFLTFDSHYSSSILSCLRAARENARSVREIISSDMWEAVNAPYLMLTQAASHADDVLETPYELYAEVKRASERYLGTTYVTMTHNEAWHFARLGRQMERGDKTSRIVDVKYFLLLGGRSEQRSVYDEIQWAALLKSASAFEMYRQRHGSITPEQVIDFLLLDPDFPRSTRYCAVGSERALHAITGNPLGTISTPAEECLGRIRAELEGADVPSIIEGGLHEHLDRFQTKLNEAGNAIASTFFF